MILALLHARKRSTFTNPLVVSMRRLRKPRATSIHLKCVATFTLLLVLATPALAQVELSAFGGYQFGGRADADLGDLTAKDGLNFGLAIDVPVRPGLMAEVLWIHQESRLRLDEPGAFSDRRTLFDMGIDYFHAGAIAYVENGPVVPFGSFALGATWFNPQGVDVSGEWRFSISVGGGVKYFLNEKVGIRLQGHLLMPMQWSGGGMWCGTSTGCAVSIGSGTVILQGEFSGGLVFKLGQPGRGASY